MPNPGHVSRQSLPTSPILLVPRVKVSVKPHPSSVAYKYSQWDESDSDDDFLDEATESRIASRALKSAAGSTPQRKSRQKRPPPSRNLKQTNVASFVLAPEFDPLEQQPIRSAQKPKQYPGLRNEPSMQIDSRIQGPKSRPKFSAAHERAVSVIGKRNIANKLSAHDASIQYRQSYLEVQKPSAHRSVTPEAIRPWSGGWMQGSASPPLPPQDVMLPPEGRRSEGRYIRNGMRPTSSASSHNGSNRHFPQPQPKLIVPAYRKKRTSASTSTSTTTTTTAAANRASSAPHMRVGDVPGEEGGDFPPEFIASLLESLPPDSEAVQHLKQMQEQGHMMTPSEMNEIAAVIEAVELERERQFINIHEEAMSGISRPGHTKPSEMEGAISNPGDNDIDYEYGEEDALNRPSLGPTRPPSAAHSLDLSAFRSPMYVSNESPPSGDKGAGAEKGQQPGFASGTDNALRDNAMVLRNPYSTSLSMKPPPNQRLRSSPVKNTDLSKHVHSSLRKTNPNQHRRSSPTHSPQDIQAIGMVHPARHLPGRRGSTIERHSPPQEQSYDSEFVDDSANDYSTSTFSLERTSAGRNRTRRPGSSVQPSPTQESSRFIFQRQSVLKFAYPTASQRPDIVIDYLPAFASPVGRGDVSPPRSQSAASGGAIHLVSAPPANNAPPPRARSAHRLDQSKQLMQDEVERLEADMSDQDFLAGPHAQVPLQPNYGDDFDQQVAGPDVQRLQLQLEDWNYETQKRKEAYRSKKSELESMGFDLSSTISVTQLSIAEILGQNEATDREEDEEAYVSESSPAAPASGTKINPPIQIPGMRVIEDMADLEEPSIPKRVVLGEEEEEKEEEEEEKDHTGDNVAEEEGKEEK